MKDKNILVNEQTGERWEVVPHVQLFDGMGYVLKPIKRKPREGWACQLKHKKHLFMESAEEAQKEVSHFSNASEWEVVKVREVLDEEE